MFKLKQTRSIEGGYTLIETLIYLVLFTFMFGGLLFSVYQVFEASAQSSDQIIVEGEANFLLRKLEWAFSGASSVTTPTSGNTGTTLVLDSGISFALNGTNLEITDGSDTYALNSLNVSITNLSFEHIAATTDRPAGVTASFEVDGTSFNTTRYVR